MPACGSTFGWPIFGAEARARQSKSIWAPWALMRARTWPAKRPYPRRVSNCRNWNSDLAFLVVLQEVRPDGGQVHSTGSVSCGAGSCGAHWMMLRRQFWSKKASPKWPPTGGTSLFPVSGRVWTFSFCTPTTQAVDFTINFRFPGQLLKTVEHFYYGANLRMGSYK